MTQRGISEAAPEAHGKLISIEGLDGSGKSTQMRMLGQWLRELGVVYLLTREPGDTDLGGGIRDLLLHKHDLAISPLAEAHLFLADRAQHFAERVIPALGEGKVVVSDRCFDSSVAMQGDARGLGTDEIRQMSLKAMQGVVPDLTILFDLPLSYLRARTAPANSGGRIREELNRLDMEADEFHYRVREGFLKIARDEPDRVKVIDATQSVEWIHHQVVLHVGSVLLSQATLFDG